MSDVVLRSTRRSVNMSVSVPADQSDVIEQFAAKMGCTRSSAVAALLEPGVKMVKEGKKLPAELR